MGDMGSDILDFSLSVVIVATALTVSLFVFAVYMQIP